MGGVQTSPRDPLHTELAVLRRENDELRGEVADLKALLKPRAGARRLGGVVFTPFEWVIVQLLASRAGATREQIGFALHQGKAERSAKAVDVLVMKVRRKLAPLAVTIFNTHGRGWWIEAADRRRLAEFSAAEEAKTS